MAQTDKPDYAPWQTAVVTGEGFAVGETVSVQILHTDGRSNDGPQHAPWLVTDGFTANAFVDDAGVTHLPDLDGQADGKIKTTWTMDDDASNSAFAVTQVGLTSGEVAQTTFTDASITSLATGNWSSAASWTAISRTGTITSATTSTTVTGTGTAFTTELAPGSIIAGVGTVASIQSSTQLTLVANASSVQSGVAYTAQVVPGAGDDVTIAAGTTITADSASVTGLSVTVASGGTLALNNNSISIGSLAGAGSVTLGTGTLTIGSANTSTTFTGVISGTNGNVVKNGSGTLTLQGVNTYTGTTRINQGGFTLSGAGTATSTAFTVYGGGNLTLDNNATNNTDRISSTLALNMSGGELIFKGSTSASTNATETIGSLNLVAGQSTITTISGGGVNSQTVLTFANITTRVVGTTVLFRGTTWARTQARTTPISSSQPRAPRPPV